MSNMQPGQNDLTPAGDPAGQDEQVGGAQEHSVGGDPQVGEAMSTESESPVRESGAEAEAALRDEKNDTSTDESREARSDGDPRNEDEGDRRQREDDFAAQHDPDNHDTSAGKEFRQRGDLITEGGRAMVVDHDGNYVDAGDASRLSGDSATGDKA